MEPVTSRGSVGWNTTDDTTSKWLVREESIYLSIDTNYITAIIFYFAKCACIVSILAGSG